MNALMVFLGGGLGALFRYGTMLATKTLFKTTLFPLGTFVSNVLSCILFAVFFTFVVHRTNSSHLQLLLLTGICGGYSTFSTFAYETFDLIRGGHWEWALLNVLFSVLVGVGLFWLLMQEKMG